ncbi:hypothetical protein CSOJ01_16026 [Colletotrichum sojae]|nr:hypothetical protein CSOJ01_16026 [Colletotrichum sojae]
MLARSAEYNAPFVALPPLGGNWQETEETPATTTSLGPPGATSKPTIDASQNSMIAFKQVEPVQNRMATIGQQLGAGASTGDLLQQTALTYGIYCLTATSKRCDPTEAVMLRIFCIENRVWLKMWARISMRHDEEPIDRPDTSGRTLA